MIFVVILISQYTRGLPVYRVNTVYLVNTLTRMRDCRALGCVCYFVLLNPYWGIVTVPGSFLKTGDLVCVLLRE